MPTYRLRYVCETSLQSETDVSLDHRGTRIVFLFSKTKPAKNAVHVVLDADAANYREADIAAQMIVQPTLDAISFATGTPLLMQYWDFIIKNEASNGTRRALWCEKGQEVAPVRFGETAVRESQQILSSDEGSTLELCWHRYALQRTLTLDRFVFQWLAFEGLAGKKQIPTVCPRCQKEVTHCDLSLSHEGSDRGKAYELFSKIDSAITAKQFKEDIWWRARNAVFHGSTYPSPKLLLDVHTLSPKLRRACDAEFNKRYNFPDQPRPSQNLEFHVYKMNMFEWKTANAEVAFADDFPWEALNKEFGNMRMGEVRARFPETSPLVLLNFNKDSANW
jgi:hypothetical protein